MLLEGVRLMVVGMTTVFAFLSLLVLAMHGTRVAAGLFPEAKPAAAKGPQADRNDEREIAVVLAALAATRGKH